MSHLSPYAVFLDVDGTIISAASPEGASPLLRRVIHEARKAGHVFFINTGRSIGNVPEALIRSAEFDGICAGLGTYAEYHGKELYSVFFPEEQVKRLVNFCSRSGDACVFEGGRNGSDGKYSFGDSGIIRAFHTAYTPETFYAMTRGQRFYKISVPYLPGREYDRLLREFFEMVYCPPVYAEGAPIGNTKGTAIQKVCRLLEIPMERSIAIGDSENDLGMLQTAGISVAMGNAPDTVKRKCMKVALPAEQDGAAKMLAQLLLPEKFKEMDATKEQQEGEQDAFGCR